MRRIKGILEFANEILAMELAQAEGNEERILKRIRGIRLLADEEAAEREGLPFGDPSHFGEDAEYLRERGVAFKEGTPYGRARDNCISPIVMQMRIEAFYGKPGGAWERPGPRETGKSRFD